jgi:hypothetical protein
VSTIGYKNVNLEVKHLFHTYLLLDEHNAATGKNRTPMVCAQISTTSLTTALSLQLGYQLQTTDDYSDNIS